MPLPLPFVISDRADVQGNFDALAIAAGRLRVLIMTGSGNPNGSVVASPPAIFLRADGGAGATLYVKETGVGTSAGWVAK